MIFLYLMRHGKSDWNHPYKDDIDRIVSKVGIDKTKKIGNFFVQENINPEKIICSPAIRTRQTLDIIINNFTEEPIIEFEKKLYFGLENNLKDLLKTQGKIKSILVIGHEPILSSSIKELNDEKGSENFKLAEIKFSTSGLFCLSFATNNWLNISVRNSKIVFFKRPKDL